MMMGRREIVAYVTGREHPILFTGQMVTAILAGTKTVTRRLPPWQPAPCQHEKYVEAEWRHDPPWWVQDKKDLSWHCGLCGNGVRMFKPQPPIGIPCRYGTAGHLLWVRERFYQEGYLQQATPDSDTYRFVGLRRIHYAQAGPPPVLGKNDWGIESNQDGKGRQRKFIPTQGSNFWKARPSIHMPRRSCRILLDVASIRLERLSLVDDQEAQLEGVGSRQEFMRLWDEINADRAPHAQDPLVFRIEFKRLQEA